jgi:tripartite-type tricarboxylate transporter receptor subunit TctC
LLVAPEGTPEDVQAKLSEALNAAMRDEAVLASFAEQGLAPTLTTPKEATQFLGSERSKWVKVIADAGIETK